MTAVPLLSRRSVGCVSDLTIDRWLLGETPGSDEARRVEEHTKTCPPCAARIGALRGLYSSRLPAPQAVPPAPLDRIPAHSPSQTGVLQFVLLRDGLLIGTEFFTPGAYAIGSGPTADLQLDGVSPLHARVYFRDGRVAVKAEGGALRVNGFKVDACEVRPIDEVAVGPYVLRSRVLRERWGEPAAPPEPKPNGPVSEATVIELPSARLTWLEGLRRAARAAPPAQGGYRLTVALWWGSSLEAIWSAEGELKAQDFPLWGFSDLRGDSLLAEPAGAGAFRVHVPPTAQAGPQDFTLAPGARFSIAEGAMRLELSVDPLVDRPPRAAFLHWPTVALATAMVAAFGVALAFVPVPEEQPFTPREMKRVVSLLPPPRPTVAVARDQHRVVPSEPKAGTRHRAPPSLASPDGLSAVARLLRGNAVASILDSTRAPGRPNARRSGGLVAGLGLGVSQARGFELGLSSDGSASIGVGGLARAGAMRSGGYGQRHIGGLVGRPRSSALGVASGATTSIDKDAVAKAIADHLAEVSACYEQALLSNGHAGGRLVLEWTITTSGVVAQAKVKSTTLKDGSIAGCVLSHLKTWRFPLARGGSAVVSYPFVFQSTDF